MALSGALLALLVARLLATSTAASDNEPESASVGGGGDDGAPDSDDDGDSAPFTIAVEHEDGRRCWASLVSLRTALTSAACARGLGDVWAVAVAAGGAPVVRPVARVALAAGAEPLAEGDHADPWRGAEADIAVLELEEPFGGGARARPIFMATDAAECAPPAACHVVRTAGRARLRLRVADAPLVAGAACAALGPRWPALRETALCLAGPRLCAADRGAGVVCAGKLCGVVSRSAAAGAGAGAEAAGDACGDTHVAQAVARWRHFLHCAHTLRACGRAGGPVGSGGECAQLCRERRLPEPSRPAASGSTLALLSPNTDAAYAAEAAKAAAKAAPTSGASQAAALASSVEFEPNRADFKAGEYGDNAADYSAGAGDDRAPARAPTHTPSPARAPTRTGAHAPTRSAPPAVAIVADDESLERAAPAPPSARSAGAGAAPARGPLAVATLLQLVAVKN